MSNVHNPKSRPNYVDEEARIQQALDKISGELKPNIAKLAQEFNVQEQRLRQGWKGRLPHHKREPQNRKLTSVEELALCQFLDQHDEIGIPSRYQQISSYANSILATSRDTSYAPAPTVSRMWTSRFLERNPQYYTRKQKAIDINWKLSHNHDNLEDWFQRYRKLKEEKGILDTDTYNFDETGFRIGIGRDQWVVTREQECPLCIGSSTNREFK